MKAFLISIIFALFFLPSCIEEFTIKGAAASSERIIVVQGYISKGDKSVIHVCYSQPLGSKWEPEPVLNAKVRIVGKNGYQSEAAEFDLENGYYWIDTKEELSIEILYALQVEADGESYQSEYLSLLDTPEIEDVVYKEDNEGISIRLQTEGSEDSSRHYMWTYEEDWEFHARMNLATMPGIIDPWYSKDIYPQKIENGHNPYYYCWGHNTSSQILIYSTEALLKNDVDIELFRIPIDDIRISYIYSLLVKQSSLSSDAYKYYSALKKFSEGSSGLFPAMPTDIKGNLKCVSNPEVRVQGYVLAANVKTKRIFIYESEFKQIRSEYENEGCFQEKPDVSISVDVWRSRWNDMINDGAIVMTTNGYWDPERNDRYMESVLYFRECVDCRTADRATKKRPDFWPNNHE